jgi:two-component system repressor protein LuxO
MVAGQSRSPPVDVIIVDADPTQCRTLAGAITGRAIDRFLPRIASSAEAFAHVRTGAHSIVIADLETIGGAERLGEIADPAVSLIATSASASLNAAVAAVKAGAVDFIPKPIGAVALIERLEAAVATWSASPAVPPPTKASALPSGVEQFAGFVGASPAMRQVYDQIRRMAPSRAPIFITGESGVGKEVAAEAIHSHAVERNRPFVAINCSAIPRDLMESEIFGHVRGAFTGASEGRAGAAELASGGTLFLDEIAEMDLPLQAKLLRFAQSGSFRRVGGTKLQHVDVRFVCATNRDPFVEVEAGRLRADLFYRLHVLPIHLPPLRDRPDDIMPLAKAFLARFSEEEGRRFVGFEPAAEAKLLAYSWPGNIRQLQNVIRRTVVLYDGELVGSEMLPESMAANITASPTATGNPRVQPARIASFRDQERRIIETALSAFGGNVPRAAAALEISPATIYRKIKTWTGSAAAD